MKVKLFILIIFSVLYLNCNVKKSQESKPVIIDIKQEEKISVFDFGYDIVYAVPFDGLNLYSEPNFNSESIKYIPRNTKLAVLEINDECEVINGTDYYWYKVDSGNGAGWAFSDNLFDKPVPNKVKNLKIAKIIAGSDNLINDEDCIYFIENAMLYLNRDILKIYNDTSFESNFTYTNYDEFFLFKHDELPGWYYLISGDCEEEGFIYIYEISSESFYGNQEENVRSGNYYQYMQNTEYEIVMKYNNLKRYGPLLLITNNNKTIEFFDTRNGGPGGIKYLLLDYYTNYDELLILKQYWEGASMSIYNIKNDEFRCENIFNPVFNNSRTYMVSLDFNQEISSYSLKLFSINNGFYKEIYNDNIVVDFDWKLNKVFWINEKNICIDYGEIGKITIEIGNVIRVIDNMPAKETSETTVEPLNQQSDTFADQRKQ